MNTLKSPVYILLCCAVLCCACHESFIIFIFIILLAALSCPPDPACLLTPRDLELCVSCWHFSSHPDSGHILVTFVIYTTLTTLTNTGLTGIGNYGSRNISYAWVTSMLCSTWCIRVELCGIFSEDQLCD